MIDFIDFSPLTYARQLKSTVDYSAFLNVSLLEIIHSPLFFENLLNKSLVSLWWGNNTLGASSLPVLCVIEAWTFTKYNKYPGLPDVRFFFFFLLERRSEF